MTNGLNIYNLIKMWITQLAIKNQHKEKIAEYNHPKENNRGLLDCQFTST
jgi:hypothetical protein